ncbi:hypothetical protein CERSUDRAFT_100231 [Gelatoporia subvermispora B]|uniref:Major facilitator superfamily (MFS) profile domain-containing protein n=1 Tax=Ceriporiopsis subvermispora (strain B) TaxID=914234 RepID=M2Q437_CERS8|nr:hypothetical protein CERSUDRAFT_100231 [Gelatoporia subvermispora B]
MDTSEKTVISVSVEAVKGSTIVDTTSVSTDSVNVGLKQFELAKQSGMRVSQKDNARIARKIDIWILPMFCISQGLSFVDKTALNYGNLYGMKAALNMNGTQFDWVAGVFYLGYLVGNYPDGWLLQHYQAGKVLAITTFVWGVIILTTPACTNFGGAAANRFCLGLMEAVVTPGLTLLTSIWYSQTEVPIRLMFWYTFNGWAGIFGGFVAYGIGAIPNPSLPRWEYIFLVLGAISIAYSIVLWFFLPDSPLSARFLSDEDKITAIKRVAEAKIGVKNTQFKAYQMREALVDPKTWLLLIASVVGQIPNGIVTNFSTVIIKGFGFSTLQSTLLSAVSSAVQIVTLIVAGWICTRYKNMCVITTAVGNIVCIIAAGCLAFLPADQRWNRLVAYWFTYFQTIGFALSLVMISNNIGGYTKKTFTTAITFVGYCVGNFAGPQFLIASQAPVYQTGLVSPFLSSVVAIGDPMVLSYIIRAIVYILLGAYMLWSNIAKDRKYGKVDTYEQQLKGEEAGMHDLTEMENIYHRYVL